MRNLTSEGVRRLERCPAHDDHHPSLSVQEMPDGRRYCRCFAGCSPERLADAMGLAPGSWRVVGPDRMGLLVRPNGNGRRPARAIASGLTLAGYAQARRLPEDFLRELGLSDGEYRGLPAVRIPYRDRDGREIAVRLRTGTGFVWQKGARLTLYGLERLSNDDKEAPILLVEGESDCHTLWHFGIFALGVPGASTWKQEWASHLEGRRIFLWQEPDTGGETLCRSVARSLPGLRVLHPPEGIKDPSEAHLKGMDLRALVQELIETASVPDRAADAKPDPADFPLTELGNAERLIATHGQCLRFDVSSKEWLFWNGRFWERDRKGEVDRRARQVIRGLYDLLPTIADTRKKDNLWRHIQNSEKNNSLKAMVELASKCSGIPVEASELDADPWLLNCPNGTLDLRTGELRPHDPRDLITKMAGAEYDPKAKAPRWEQFLQEVFQGDEELIAYFQRVAGYCLTGDTREECVFILHGKGQSGKSKAVETLRAVLGDYAMDTPVSTFTERRESNTDDLARLIGARLVTAAEANTGEAFNEALLKRLSGRDPITARRLYQSNFTYNPTFKVLISTNEIPRIKSQDFAMRRRLKILPFRQRFYDPEDGLQPVKDTQLLGKLLAEKAGILAWAVEGCLKWQQEGLPTPPEVREVVNAVFESQDPLAEFIEEQCELDPRAEGDVKELWRAYQSWCDANGIPHAFKRTNEFSRCLLQRDGIESRRTMTRRFLAGIRIRE